MKPNHVGAWLDTKNEAFGGYSAGAGPVPRAPNEPQKPPKEPPLDEPFAP